MPALAITVTGTEALTRRLLELGEDAPKAATRAVNRTVSSVRSATVKALAQNTGLTNKVISEFVATTRATWSRQIGAVRVSSKRIPLIYFAARQTRRGVTYRGAGRRGLVPSAFIRTVRSPKQVDLGSEGHLGVFARKGPKRLPIVEQFGPSLPSAFVKSGSLFEQQAAADAILEKNLRHEIDRIIQLRFEGGDE